MGSNILPITVLNQGSEITGWDTNSQLIIACEFISQLDKG